MGSAAERKPSLFTNAISSYAALGMNIIVVFFLTPIVIRYVGKPGYGIWQLIRDIVGYYGLLYLGVSTAVTRYVSFYASKEDKDSLNDIITNSLYIFTGTGILVILVSYMLAGPASHFFRVPPDLIGDFKRVIQIMGWATAVTFLAEMFNSILTAYELFIPANSVKILAEIVRGLTIPGLLILGMGVPGVALGMLASQLVIFIGSTVLVFKLIPDIRLRLTQASLKQFSLLFNYSGITMLVVLGDYFRMNLDSFVIGKWIGMEEIAVFGIAATLIKYMFALIFSGMRVLRPRFTSLFAKNEMDDLRFLFRNSLTVASFLAFGCATGAVIFGGSFINLWVGEGFEKSMIILVILVIPFAFDLAQNPGIELLYAVNKHKFYAYSNFAEASMNLILSILLVHEYGIVGVAIGTALPMIFIKLFVQPLYISRIIGLSYLEYFWHQLPPVAAMVSVVGISVGLVAGIRQADSIVQMIIKIIPVACSYVFLAFLLIGKNKRKVLMEPVMVRIRRFT